IDGALQLGDQAAVLAVMTAHDSAAYQGVLPSSDLQAWAQGWSPLFLEWKLDYRYIGLAPGQVGSQPWTFDGFDYQYTPGGSPPSTVSREIGGISKIGPSAQFVFKSRLDAYLRQYPNADLSQLEAWIQQIDDWKFLGQQLTGFHDLLAMQDSRAFRRPVETDTVGTNPSYSVADLAGFPTTSAPGQRRCPGTITARLDRCPTCPTGPRRPFRACAPARPTSSICASTTALVGYCG
ncbi:MAG: hypothetical protein HC927_00685, partial [Deltaproteobacteria bacterium]|nr:hypothetical protein [Deltaproteobacteria bacterium]